MRWIPLLTLILGCASAAPFEERRLGAIPEGARIDVPVAFSTDGRHAAWVEKRSDACRMVFGGHAGKPYGLLC